MKEEEHTLSTSRFIPTENHTLLSQRLPNQISALRRDVIIERAVDERQLALNVTCAGERIITASTKGATVQVSSEVGDCGGNTGV